MAQGSVLANVLTLGVQDLDVLRAFYQKLQWPLVLDRPDHAAFELRGAVLALFPVQQLAADGGGHEEIGRGGIRFSMGILVNEPADVDRLAEMVRRAGGRVTKDPVDAEHFVGRSAYFADPEGNYWEIAWAPPDNPILAAARRAAGLDGPKPRLP